MNADPKIPPTTEEERESDEATVSDVLGHEKSANTSTAENLLLPPFLLVQAWAPDNYDEVLLDWWGEGYLMECGSLHADARLAEHDHGRILALVVLDPSEETGIEEARPIEEDWVEECRAIATASG